ncbi:MAG TPA: hypothetical protein EYN40_05500 [Planctomycetes bacterium]|nr:hypothetical protein [Planctomycetota bacterium]
MNYRHLPRGFIFLVSFSAWLLGCQTMNDLTSQPEGPWTRAESSDASQTSSLADVKQFISELKSQGAPITVSTLGTSAGGLEIPMVVLADPPCSDGAEARASGRAVVYIQANIHGGEVEGKEAAQVLLREACQGERPSWMKNLVTVWVPIYNVDGNEALGPGLRQRGHQDGPDPIGRRTNDDRLDLNRDCLKADSPEMRSVLEKIWKVWDPHVVLDLHTTNGTRHGYSLTYSPSLGADVDAEIQHWSKQVLLPDVQNKLREKHGILTFDYGNSSSRGEGRSWSSFSALPRYVSNHAGERNRIGILSEATSFLPFAHRIEATYLFTGTVIDHVAAHVEEVLRICASADRRSALLHRDGASLGIAFETRSRGIESLLLEKKVEGRNTPAHKGPQEVESIPHDVRVDFVATESVQVPAGWIVPAEETSLIELLGRHQIDMKVLSGSEMFTVETLWISRSDLARRPYQNRRNRTISGELAEENHVARAGDVLVPSAQNQVRIAFWLLDPRSPDGATTWSILEDPQRPGTAHPIRRVISLGL